MKRLTHSSAPEQVLGAYTDFWQKAAQDYGNEITIMSKLMPTVTTKVVAAAQVATEEASESVSSREATCEETPPVTCDGGGYFGHTIVARDPSEAKSMAEQRDPHRGMV